MTHPLDRSFLANFWRRWPITIITTIVMVPVAGWNYIHLSASPGPTITSNTTVQNFPARPSNALPGTRRSHTQAAPEAPRVLPAFRRVQVAPNEVDYIAEDVTMRIFTPPPKPTPIRRWNEQVDIGGDVTIRYFAGNAPAKTGR